MFSIYFNSKTKSSWKSEKEFSEENNEIKVSSSGREIEKDKKLLDSYSLFKYLIENINLEKNFKDKLIYLDLYLNLLTPKSEIMNKLDDLTKTIEDTKNRLTKSEAIINSLVDYIKQKDPNFKIENVK